MCTLELGLIPVLETNDGFHTGTKNWAKTGFSQFWNGFKWVLNAILTRINTVHKLFWIEKVFVKVLVSNRVQDWNT